MLATRSISSHNAGLYGVCFILRLCGSSPKSYRTICKLDIKLPHEFPHIFFPYYFPLGVKLDDLRTLFDEMCRGELSFDSFLHEDVSDRITRKVDDSRVVYSADSTLRFYHRFLQRHFIKHLYLNPEVVYSYRKGFNVVDAVKQHSKSKYFYQTDLSNFFDCISSELVYSTLKRSSSNMNFLNAEEYFERVVQLLTLNDRLVQGFSPSPSVSNACLAQLDDSFNIFCKENNLKFTRYCDDVIISGNSESDVRRAFLELSNLVKKIYEGKFSFNLKKSKFTKVGRKIKFLGMVILPNGTVTIDSTLKKKIEVLLHYYTTDSFTFLRLVQGDLEKGIKSLAGYVSFVNAVDTAYFSKLCLKYSHSTMENLLRAPKKE